MEKINSINEFDFKLKLIEKELSAIGKIIDRLDKMCQNTKYWTIIIFIGVSSAILGSKTHNITKLIILTPIIPILFWIVDTNWRRHQNRAIFRSRKISEFINSTEFKKSFECGGFRNFTFWDEMGVLYKNDADYIKFTSFKRVFWFKTIWQYYLGLIFLGIIMSFLTY